MNKFIFCIILVCIFIIILYYKNIDSFSIVSASTFKNSKPIENDTKYVWTYWENKNNNTIYPTHISMCFKTMKKHLSKYKFIILDEKTIKNYLPDLGHNFDNMMIAQKVDYYRIALLYKYGGVWIDADVIVMKNFDDIFQKLTLYDFVGFGCTGMDCSYGYSRPSNWVLAAKKNSILMKKCLEKLDTKINNKTIINDYHEYGKIIIWESIAELLPFNYKYWHYGSEYDGNRDFNKHWIHSPNHFSKNKTIFLDESKIFFVVLYNSEINETPEYHWVRNCSEKKLIDSPYWISTLFKKALL